MMRLSVCVLMLVFTIIYTLHYVASICVPEKAKFGVSSKQKGYLMGHVTKKVTARSVVDCVAHCGRHPECVSVNYALESGNCELNTEIISTAHAGDFVSNDDIVYIERLPMWLQWGAWSSCSRTCGDGTQTRSRTCCGPGSNPTCVGSDAESRSCNQNPIWLQWEAWGACSQTCGNGTQTRNRTCCGPVANPDCVGSDTETQSCSLELCPTWGTWGSWDACSRCGQYRSRVCEDPEGTGGSCVGDDTASQDCDMGSCNYRGCGGTLTDYAADFGIDSYANSITCDWNIQVDTGKRITLYFRSLDTDSGDHVHLYLGDSSPIFYGSTKPSGNYVSSSNTMRVRFHSDSLSSPSRTGFVLHYHSRVD